MKLLPYPQVFDVVMSDCCEQSVASVECAADCDARVSSFAYGLRGSGSQKLILKKDEALVRHDEYRIMFSEDSIAVNGGTDAGIYRGLTTLRQMQKEQGFPAEGTIHDWADCAMRIQHVDLKRLGWNFDYLLELMESFADMKINYILLEYEDKFPFEGCPDISVKSAFTKAQIAELDKKATDSFIQIIPLVQCIGHFEYILKRERYLELSESPMVRSQACPLHPGTFELFKRMAIEVMDAHPSSTHFHIGADEPFLLGTCPKCKAESERIGKGRLYGEFLNKVLSWVIEEKGKIPLFWADILERHDDVAEMCRKDSIVIEWQYNSLAEREKQIMFYQHKFGKIDKDIFQNDLSDDIHAKFDKYVQYDEETEDFLSLPFGAYLRDLGFGVVSASHVNFVDNVKSHSIAVKRDGLLGNVATYWAAGDSASTPYAIFEMRRQGVCMLAASTWNLAYEEDHRDSFFQRVAARRTGDESLALLYEVFDLTGHLIVPGDSNRWSDEYIERIERVLEDIPRLKGHNLSILGDFVKKMELEKDIAQFKKENLKHALLPESCYNRVNLLPYSNERFANTDEIPGWSRIFENDLRFFPKGDVCFNGVPFRINPDSEAGSNSLIMVGDYDATPFFPHSVEGIKIETKAHALNFVHAHIEGKAQSNGYYGKYVLNYADGQTEDIPLYFSKNMGGWWQIIEIEEASVAWSGKNLKKANVGLYIYTYFPARRDAVIDSIDFICESKTALALAAVTAVLEVPQEVGIGGEELAEKIEAFQSRASELDKLMREDLKPFLSTDGIDEVVRIAFRSTSQYLSKLINGITTNNKG